MGAAPHRLEIGLLHHPVLNRSGEIIGSAVTNLDLHDIARTARTYGIGRYHVATPYEDQHRLIGEIVAHWQCGHGALQNPARKEALSLIRTTHGLDDMIADMTERFGSAPLLVVTSAKQQKRQIEYEELRNRLKQDTTPVLLLFGTAHGLAPDVVERADAALPPIRGSSTYNHLAVRAAVAIILDRLLGREVYY